MKEGVSEDCKTEPCGRESGEDRNHTLTLHLRHTQVLILSDENRQAGFVHQGVAQRLYSGFRSIEVAERSEWVVIEKRLEVLEESPIDTSRLCHAGKGD